MKTQNSERDIFKTGTNISDSRAWIFSLIPQIRELLAERRNPSRRAEITAEPDPNALRKLVDPPSQIASLMFSIQEIVHDALHPRHFEMTATPVQVREIWSKRQNHVPGLLSLLAHVSVITALIVLSVVTNTKPKPVLENSLILDSVSFSLPPSSKPGGGGGGGTRSPTPASRGVLPKASDKQFVPPTPIITNIAPELIAEPTIVTPEISNLPKFVNLVQIGLPNGILGPLSAGKGTDGGIGDGVGHGVGPGDGPGFGPGKDGGNGGNGPPAVFRAGAPGVTNPNCPVQIEPNYSDDARKAHIQGTVLLAVTVQKDGSLEPNKVIQGLGYGLDDEAKKVLNKWKCNPGRYNGQAVAIPIQIQINFRLY